MPDAIDAELIISFTPIRRVWLVAFGAIDTPRLIIDWCHLPLIIGLLPLLMIYHFTSWWLLFAAVTRPPVISLMSSLFCHADGLRHYLPSMLMPPLITYATLRHYAVNIISRWCFTLAALIDQSLSFHWINIGHSDTVIGWCSATDVSFMNTPSRHCHRHLFHA